MVTTTIILIVTRTIILSQMEESLLKAISEKDKVFLKTYDSNKYEKPSVTVDMLIFTVDLEGKLELLLIRRKHPPYQDCWAIPGGFVNMNESLEESAARELREETGIDNVHMEQLYTFGDVDRDPRTRVISVAYMALIPKSQLNIVAGDDAADAKWFQVSLSDDNLSFNQPIDLAFDHEYVIKLAIDRLRGKLAYTNIAFNLLRDKYRFTVYELQKINEAILGKELDTPNFRRSFVANYLKKNLVTKLPERSDEFSKRPSQYYSIL